jgi:hypothetical protein
MNDTVRGRALPETDWRKGGYSGTGGCVDVWVQRTAVWVRNSKDPAATTVVFTRDEWEVFLAAVKAGEFDPVRRLR